MCGEFFCFCNDEFYRTFNFAFGLLVNKARVDMLWEKIMNFVQLIPDILKI